MDFKVHPLIQSAIATGAVVGTAFGFVTEGERLEAEGAPTSQQITGALGTGAMDGLIGAGTGLGVSGTGLALAKILGK